MSNHSQLNFATRNSPTTASLITSLAASIFPISLIWKFRWNSRFGLDHLHLLLIQLLFFILALRLSPRARSHARTSSLPVPQPSSRTKSQSKPKSDNQPIKSTDPKEDVQDELHQKTIKTLLEVVEPRLLPSDHPRGPQTSVGLSDWQPIFPDAPESIHVLQHPSTQSLYAVRMKMDDVDVERLLRCLRKKKQWEWDRMCESGGDLEEKVSWVRLKGSWPIKPKEMVMYATSVRLSPETPLRILCASTTVTHPLKKSDVSVKYAGYLIEQVPDQESSSQFTLVIDLASFGSLPTFIIKTILTKYIPSSLRLLHKLAKTFPASTPTDLQPLPPLWDPSNRPKKEKGSITSDKVEEPLQEIVGQLKQLLSTLSTIHGPPQSPEARSNKWTDRAWFWAGTAGLMMSSGIALRILNQARGQRNSRQ